MRVIVRELLSHYDNDPTHTFVSMRRMETAGRLPKSPTSSFRLKDSLSLISQNLPQKLTQMNGLCKLPWQKSNYYPLDWQNRCMMPKS